MSRPSSSRHSRRISPPDASFGLQTLSHPSSSPADPSSSQIPGSSSSSPYHSPRQMDTHREYSSGSSSTPRSSTSTTSSRAGWTTPASRRGSNEDEESLQHSTANWDRREENGSLERVRENQYSKTKRDWRWILHSALDMLGIPSERDILRSKSRRKGMRRDREKRTGGRIGVDRRPATLSARLKYLLPTSVLGILSFLLCFIMFAATLTMTLKYVLNPDKAALPWRQYCLADYPTLYSLQDPSRPNEISPRHENLVVTPLTARHPSWPYKHPQPYSYETNQTGLDNLQPVGIFVGVFSMDSGVKRRELVRHSYAAHPFSRTESTKNIRVRFIIGRPRSEYVEAVKAEQEEYGDIVVLDIEENMNSGKTHAFFSWAAEGATVPHWEYPRSDDEERSAVYMGERPAQYVIKADDDAFLMLGELERRLRVAPREMAYWGYLVKNRFMGGECYGLSMDLVTYVANTPVLRTMTHGKEDVLVSKWLRLHPESQSIIWTTDKCWMYDHPKAGTVYSHGFLYPSEVAVVRQEHSDGLDDTVLRVRGGQIGKDAYSTVTKFGTAYRTYDRDMTREEKVEALVEGSQLSLLRDERLLHPKSVPSGTLRERITRLYEDRPSRKERFLYDPEERGGTVLVHYIKKPEWFRETMVAMLGTAEPYPAWREEGQAR